MKGDFDTLLMLFIRILRGLSLLTFRLNEALNSLLDRYSRDKRKTEGVSSLSRGVLGGKVLVVVCVCFFRGSFETRRIGFILFSLKIVVFWKDRHTCGEVILGLLWYPVPMSVLGTENKVSLVHSSTSTYGGMRTGSVRPS